MRAVDLFAGWGGFTEGAEQAGVDVVWAANHSKIAVAAHAINHPKTKHVCQDLQQANWTELPAYDLLLASPACQGNSRAGQPSRKRSAGVKRNHDALRATAWAVVNCADITEPKAVIIENVPEFRREWRLYPEFLRCLRKLGYDVQEMIIRASYHGTPQRRDRLFVVATRKPIDLSDFLTPTLEPAFGPCVDWDFGDWRPTSKAGAGAKDRFRAARKKHNGARCIMQHTTGHRGISPTEPIRTITTKDQWHLLDGRRYRPLTMREYARAMGFPDHYSWPLGLSREVTLRGLGNAVCPPLARKLVERVAQAA